jgi:hypothetical protein
LSWVSLMRMRWNRRRMAHTVVWTWMALLGTAAGCISPAGRTASSLPAPVLTANPAESGLADFHGRVIGPEAAGAVAETADPSSLVDTWVVHTRACEQKMGTDPWSSITVARFDGLGVPLHGTRPEALLERMAGRTCVFLIHGYGYSYRDAVQEAVTVRGQLEAAGGLPSETLFIVFDWPSEREQRDLYADLNEKSRRTRIAAFHLARFLQESPAGSRFCLLGQSDGGRLALTTMHLLSGALLPSIFGEPSAQLSGGRPDLRFRCVIVNAAAGHHWLNPGQRLDQALPSCEALFNIYNTGDAVLMFFILGRFTGFRPAIGMVGLTSHDMAALGPLSARVEQIDLHSRVGFSHTSVPQALRFSDIAGKIAHYTSFSGAGATIP